MQKTLGASPFHPAPHVAPSQPFQAGRSDSPNHPPYRPRISTVSGQWSLSHLPFPIPLAQGHHGVSSSFRSKGWVRIRDRLRRHHQGLIRGCIRASGYHAYRQGSRYQRCAYKSRPAEGNLKDSVEFGEGEGG